MRGNFAGVRSGSLQVSAAPVFFTTSCPAGYFSRARSARSDCRRAKAADHLRPFLKSSVPQIVSKCVLILGRRCQNLAWMRNVMAENDDRVRANLIESLWKRRDKEVEPILRDAVKDSDHRVAANAVYALFLAGSDHYAEGLDRLI